MKSIIIFLLALLTYSSNSYANKVDSLLGLAKISQDKQEKLQLLNQVSWAYQHDYFLIDSSLYYANMAKNLNSEDAYPAEYGRSVYYIASSLTRMADYVSAGECYNQAILIAKKCGDENLEEQATSGLAWHYYSVNKLEDAIDRFNSCYVLYEAADNKMGMVSSLIGLSNCYMELSRFEEAKISSAKASELSRILENHGFLISCLSTQARACRMSKDFKGALGFMGSVDSLAAVSDLAHKMGTIEDEKSALYCDMGDYERSMVHLDKSIEYALISADFNRYGNLIWSKQDLYARMGMWDSAYTYNVLLHELEDSVMGIEQMKNIEEIETKYQTEKKEKDLALAEIALMDQEKISIQGEKNFNKLIMITVLIAIILITLLVLFLQRRKATKALENKNKIIHGNLKEKELLLGEIHHRVKNNLQLVSTMLELQSKHDQDPKFADLVKESCSRIQTMSLIHQVLYQYDDLSGVGMDNYLRNLIDKLHQAYSSKEVKTVFDIEDITIGIDTAIPLALVVNEIYTNSLKYAFEKEGVVTISLIDKKEYLELQITDDGKGFEKDQVKENFGSKLIKSFSRQLDATVEIFSKLGEGTSTHIKINRFERI